MRGKTENIRPCFKMNEKIFPLFITENKQLSSAQKYSATAAFLMKIFSSGRVHGVYDKHPLEWKL